jgi:GTPase KRas protein
MLEVLDTAGQEDYTALRDQWVREGEGFVLVYSITSRSSFSRIQKFHQHIQRVKGPAHHGGGHAPSGGGFNMPMSSAVGAQAPVMLVGNKSDRGTDRDVSMQEGQALARSLGCDFVEASAKDSINVEKAFYDVVRHLRQQRQQSIPRPLEPKSLPPPAAVAANPTNSTRANNGRKGHRPKCTIL